MDDLFHVKIDKSGGPDACWLWVGARNPRGYGTLCRKTRGVAKFFQAHRVAMEEHLGHPIPQDLYVCHHCDRPPCVNPAHLFL